VFRALEEDLRVESDVNTIKHQQRMAELQRLKLELAEAMAAEEAEEKEKALRRAHAEAEQRAQNEQIALVERHNFSVHKQERDARLENIRLRWDLNSMAARQDSESRAVEFARELEEESIARRMRLHAALLEEERAATERMIQEEAARLAKEADEKMRREEAERERVARERDQNERAETARQQRLGAEREQWEAANRENEARAAALEASFKQLQLERDKYAQIAANEASEKERIAQNLAALNASRTAFDEAEKMRQLTAAQQLDEERARLQHERMQLEADATAEADRLAQQTMHNEQVFGIEHAKLRQEHERAAHEQYAKEMELLHVQQQTMAERDAELRQFQASQDALLRERTMVQSSLSAETDQLRFERNSVMRDAETLRADAQRLRADADSLRNSMSYPYYSAPAQSVPVLAPAPGLAPVYTPGYSPYASTAAYMTPRYWSTLGSVPPY
jgi:hypothetical protein